MTPDKAEPQTQDEPQAQDGPDKDCQVAVEPLEASEAVSGNAAPASGVGFNPDAPVALSAPPPEMLSGTPTLTSGENDEALASGSSHTEANATDGTNPDGEPDEIQ